MGKKNRVSESSEKAEKLKSLNKMLLKEACERRKQVNSLASELALLKDNDFFLISQLDKNIMSLFIVQQMRALFDDSLDSIKNDFLKLKTTVTKFHDLDSNLEYHKELVVQLQCEMGALNDKLTKTELDLENQTEVLRITCVERDELKGLLDGQVVVKRKFKEKGLFELRKRIGVRKRVKDGGFELRKRNRELAREIGELRDALVGEKELLERIECVVGDKDLVEKRCGKLEGDLSRTEEDLRVVVRDMGVIREAKDVEVKKRCKLETGLRELNETVVSLREGERRLLVNVEILENRCVEGEEKRKLMGKKIDRLLTERKCKEKSIEGLMSEQIALDKKLQQTLSQLWDVKCKLEQSVKHNVGLLEAKNVEVEKRCELENVVNELNATMVGLREKEQRLVVNVAELEGKCVENEEKQRVMRKKIDKLLEERKCNEKSIEGLMDEQIMLERKLQETLIELHNWKCKLEHLVKQNISLLKAKQMLYCDVRSYEKQVAELKILILRLEESNKVRESAVKSLESKVVNYTCKIECFEAERSKLGSCLYEDKQNVVTLKEQIENREMNLEESVKGSFSVEKKDLKNQCESLKKEIASLKSETDKAKVELSKMRGNVALAASESELVMNMLDCTLTCCLKGEGESKDGDLSGEETCSGEAKQCGEKFEMIKKAFEVKEAKVDSMRKQVEFLKHYVEEVSKKNSVWNDLALAYIFVTSVFSAYILRG